ncbi:MAG: rhodanese-like domain-containing protein [Campylobacterota bacterium]|nr:rhodanese-like domain-containing protein [Campylobacterota bacterium]
MNKMIKVFVSVVLLATVSIASGDLNIIPLKKAKGMFNAKSALFLDARGYKLYQKGTIMGAVHMPTKQFKRFSKFLPANKNVKIVSFCNGIKCEESDHLAHKLMDMGYTRVMVYKGGYPEWKEEKLPLMSLVKECKTEPKGPYVPNKDRAISINGANVYFGGEEIEDGMIDQFWLAEQINSGKGIPANVQMIDVRKPSQFKEGHIQGAINVPWDAENEKVDHTKFPKDKLSVIYCNTGMQSTDARGSLDDDIAANVLYFDANIKCEGTKCTITANEDL